MNELDDVDRAVLNAFQGRFPVEERPFERAAEELRRRGVDVSQGELVERVRRLDDEGYVSRFGALIDAEAIGGNTVLVATRAEPEEFDEVVEAINRRDEVAHNYERDHDLNVWFVVSVADRGEVEEVLAEVEAETGVETYAFPKLREYHLGAYFPVDGPLYAEGLDVEISTTPGVEDVEEPDERALLAEIHAGFPVSSTPYADVGERLDVGAAAVVSAVRRLLDEGKIRRVGVVPDHYAIGYTENEMTVWDVPDDVVDDVGESVGALPFVTHCYRRPRHGELWPYNLFAMVHGRTEEEVEGRVDRVRETVEEHTSVSEDSWDTLVSTRVLKKTGINL